MSGAPGGFCGSPAQCQLTPLVDPTGAEKTQMLSGAPGSSRAAGDLDNHSPGLNTPNRGTARPPLPSQLDSWC